MSDTDVQQFSMLKILLAACETAAEAFRAADNALDADLLDDLERMIHWTRRELTVLAERLAPPAATE